MRVHQEGVSGWNDRAGVSVDINSVGHKHCAPKYLTPGREGWLYIDPLDHSLSILCLRGMTQWASCSVMTFEFYVSKLSSANLSSASRCHVTPG